MHSLNRSARVAMTLVAALALAAALAITAFQRPAAASPASLAGAGSRSGVPAPQNGCSYSPVNGGYQWVCRDSQANTGGHASGASGPCVLTPQTEQNVTYLLLPWPAPKGQSWEEITCPGGSSFAGLVLANGGQVTPQQLAWEAAQTDIPDPRTVQTVPPSDKDGLVGLPEWFWVPRSGASGWENVPFARLTAGAVWVNVTATPVSIVVSPGSGLPSLPCNGPGTAYDFSLAASVQHSDCSYTYEQPSAGQPENAYGPTVTVSWQYSWVGPGGSHGIVPFDRQVITTLPLLRVAAGEALVTGG